MKKLFISAIASFAMLAPIAQAKDYKISHVRPQGTAVDNDIRAMAEALNGATDGQVNLEIFAASALGDYTTVQERITVGAIDMAVQPASASVDRRLQLATFPYIASNWDQARDLYATGGPIANVVKELLADQGIAVLATYPVYFGGISLNRDAISPGDPSVKNGIKVRVPGIKSFQLTGDALGYISTPIPFSEAFTAVQTGVVDGVIGSGAEGYFASFRDVTKTYIPANTHFEAWFLMASQETLDGMGDDDRKALLAAALTFETSRWENAEADQELNEQRLVDEAGTTIVELTGEQLAAMAEKARAEIWPVILNDVGAEWGQSILDQIN
ncbi:TRAP transporter substrate-binding protein DctP [Sulfitobacter sp. 20_GPM-1509m]|uniref:TRAP transporter substrate-binding protein DctP n=1 Tax=Sulfitobacter sp. 20_GPM-1509m TaxID=1380367 RepID=UPI000688D58A|nr:TRAP transporter substrate-binding protein DctP [Sulfitobacter sp. 20_GPM-1509m]